MSTHTVPITEDTIRQLAPATGGTISEVSDGDKLFVRLPGDGDATELVYDMTDTPTTLTLRSYDRYTVTVTAPAADWELIQAPDDGNLLTTIRLTGETNQSVSAQLSGWGVEAQYDATLDPPFALGRPNDDFDRDTYIITTQ